MYAIFQCTYSYCWQGRDVWNRDAYGIVNVERGYAVSTMSDILGYLLECLPK